MRKFSTFSASFENEVSLLKTFFYQLSLWISKYIAQVLPINIRIPKHFKVESYLAKSLKNKVLVPHWESPLESEITKAVKNSEDEKSLIQI